MAKSAKRIHPKIPNMSSHLIHKNTWKKLVAEAKRRSWRSIDLLDLIINEYLDELAIDKCLD